MATFALHKQPVVASQAAVVCNHPIASTVGINILASGGNAADAAVAAAFTLSIVEPMMIGPLGGGYILHRDSAGYVSVIDNYATGPRRAREDMYEPDPAQGALGVKDRKNEVGHLAAGVPGNLAGWLELHRREGSLPLSRLIAPAISYAENGFPVSAYTVECIRGCIEDLARFPDSARIYLRSGKAPEPGDLQVNQEAAESLRLIEREGAKALYGGGPIGEALVRDQEANGGIIDMVDLAGYQLKMREPIRGTYRGHDIIGTPPSSGGGILNQLGLNILENFDVGSMGFGTVQYWHLLLEVLKIMYADRAKYLGDPDFVAFPLDGLLSKDYAKKRAQEIDLNSARQFSAGTPDEWRESNNTTHLTVMTADGSTVAMTQTLNNTFGSRVVVPGTGLLLNNNMTLFDPRPGKPNSPGPGKRMLTATAATIVEKDGKVSFSLGTPGGLRIFPTVLQGIINVIDHGMNLQESVEAPRVWTAGQAVEVEAEVAESVLRELQARGHTVTVTSRIAGGMNGVQVDATTGLLMGAACWRADGSPAGLSGGPALEGKAEGGTPYPMKS